MKRIIGLFLAAAMLLALAPLDLIAAAKTRFLDVNDEDYYAPALDALLKMEIWATGGGPDFNADDTVTRAEMTVLVCRMADENASSGIWDGPIERWGEPAFNDVEILSWYGPYINIAADKNIINGDGDGNFRPDDNVIYEEAVKMIVRALGYDDNIEIDPEDWSAAYLEVADKKGITNNVRGKKGEAITRGDATVIIYNGLISDLYAPVALLAEGSYTGERKVELTTRTEGAEIYYTTDGSYPDMYYNYRNTRRYSEPVIISKTCTLKAVTVKRGALVSDVTSVKYTIY